MESLHRKAVFQILAMKCILVVCLFVLGCKDKGIGDPNEYVETERVAPAPPSIAKTERPIREHRNLWDHLEHVSIPMKQVSGIAWADGSLWVLDGQKKEVCRIDKAGKKVESLSFPSQSSPHGLVYDGKAFWTWDSKSRSFQSLTLDGKQNSIEWRSGVGKALDFYDGKLLFMSADKTKMQYLDIGTKNPGTLDAPCKGIKDFVWDGRSLWCLATAAGEVYSAKLIGYDIRRQMAFTYIPFSKGCDYVTFGAGRFWLVSRLSSTQDDLNVVSFPMPKNGDVCLGPLRRYIRVFAGGVGNSHPRLQQDNVTVVLKGIPLDDDRMKVEKISFDPLASVFEYEDVFRWLVFSDITIPPRGFRSIHGTVEYSLRMCHHIILPDDIPQNQAVPTGVADEYLRITADMRHPSLVDASRQTGAARESNPYWKMRKIHDWILGRMKTADPPDDKRLFNICQVGYGACAQYTALMTALCRLNGIPSRNHGEARPYTAHAWNSVYLPGGIGWVDIDVQLNDIKSQRSGSFNYYMIENLAWERYATSGRIPGRDLPTVPLEGVQIPFDFKNCAFEGNGSMLKAHLVKFDFEDYDPTTASGGPPACPRVPQDWENRDGTIELVWPQGYDIEDGTNLSYEIYASPTPMKGQRNREDYVTTVKTNHWRIQDLRSTSEENYYFAIVALDSDGNRPHKKKKGAMPMKTRYLERKEVFSR